MCGICGFTGSPDFVTLQKITDSIFHRGPDDNGYYYDANISMGMRRLSILDVDSGKQPIHNEDKSLWTVFNGEIYNFQALRSSLLDRGHRFYTDHSDTELIVHLYEEYGEKFPNEINGMFAIALWDRNARKLYLIRDRMGVKPIFYGMVKGELLFASEIKAILQHPVYQKRPNYDALYHYFTFKNIPAPFTAFEGIHALLPGEMLIYSNRNIVRKKWWEVSFAQNDFITEDEAKAELLFLLEDSTRLRMICDVPFGAYLSGGVDSSAVVALMRRFSSAPIKTFSLGYEDELKNKEADLYYAKQVASAYKTEHREYIMSYNELLDNIENIIAAFDQPFSGTVSTFFLSKLIKKHVKVALSGDGADELFGSYLSHRLASPMHYFKNLCDLVIAGKITKEQERLFLPCDIKFLRELYDKSGGDEILWRYNLYTFTDVEKMDLLSDEFKARLKNADTFSIVKDNFSSLTSNDPLNRMLEMEFKTQFPDQVLAFVDSLSMAHSVEIRSPFLDYRLVEFAAKIPGCMKIKDGNVKAILKSTVEPLLPPGITKRPKEGFVLPIFDWMMGGLSDYCDDMLAEEKIRKHGLLDAMYVKKKLHEYQNGNKSLAGKIWNIMMFQVWWEKNFS